MPSTLLVLSVSHIETPVARIFDAPVGADQASKLLDSQKQAADVVSNIQDFRSSANIVIDHQADRSQALPSRSSFQVWRDGELDVRPRFVPAVFVVGLDELPRVDPREIIIEVLINVLDDGLMQSNLIGLQAQHIVSTIVHDLAGNARSAFPSRGSI